MSIASRNSSKRASWPSIDELLLTMPSFLWMALFFLLPTALVFLLAFHPTAQDGSVGEGWTLETWRTISNPNYPSIVWRTLWLSVVATFLSIAIALPCAFAMARTSHKWRSVLVGLIILPFWTSFLIRVFAWTNILHPDATLSRALHTDLGGEGFLFAMLAILVLVAAAVLFVIRYFALSVRMASTNGGRIRAGLATVLCAAALVWFFSLWLGFTSSRLNSGVFSLVAPDRPLLYNSVSILVVMVYTYLPFAILPIYAAAEKFDFNLVEAALDLGAKPAHAFLRVFVPGVRAGVLSAILMVLIPAIGSYVIPDMVGGSDAEMIGSKIYQRAVPERNLPHASALSAILVLAVLVPPGIAWLVFRRRHIGAVETDVVSSISAGNLGASGGRRRKGGRV